VAKATPIRGLSAPAKLREAGPRILTARLRDVERHLPGLPAEDPVHDARVATRRLRAALRLLRLRELETKVKELQDALGDVRDLQLQISWLRGRDEELREKRERLLQGRLRSLPHALARFRDATVPELMQAAGQANFPGHLAGGEVRRLLRKRLARFEERLEAALARPGPLPMHRMRISVKQVRYLFELLAQALPGASKLLLAELPPLQEALGELHDTDVRIRLLRAHQRGLLLRAEEDARGKLAKMVEAELARWKEQETAPRAGRLLR
jgi:CHAD domain-containing protein